MNPVERVLRNIEPEPNSGCWLWIGPRFPGGQRGFTYLGRRTGRRSITAHRAVWLLLRGPIAKGLVLDHRCRNSVCVNPVHLEPVTQRVNIQRAHALTPWNLP